MQIDLFVFDRSPQSFHKHIVPPGSPAVHADFASASMDRLDKLFSGELASLVSVDDFRRAMAVERLLEDIDSVAGLKGDGNFGRQHLPTGPVNHSCEVEKPLAIRI